MEVLVDLLDRLPVGRRQRRVGGPPDGGRRRVVTEDGGVQVAAVVVLDEAGRGGVRQRAAGTTGPLVSLQGLVQRKHNLRPDTTGGKGRATCDLLTTKNWILTYKTLQHIT